MPFGVKGCCSDYDAFLNRFGDEPKILWASSNSENIGFGLEVLI